jgi:uncharacterized YigZ family protein
LNDTYKTIEGPAGGLYKEKGSRFISLASPVTTGEEIKELLATTRARYFDARHHCHAWALGAGRERSRASDDGEPPSTAGKPILGQILARDLTDVLVVVVRYFGGTKLGVPGLIRAYRAAAADALDHAAVVEKTVDETLDVAFNYLAMNDVMKVLKEEAPRVVERDFGTSCRVTLRVRRNDAPRLRERLLAIESTRLVDL